jgi:hypothetical protein
MKGSVVLPLWGACGVGAAIAHVRTGWEVYRLVGDGERGCSLGSLLTNLIDKATSRPDHLDLGSLLCCRQRPSAVVKTEWI